MTGDLYQCLFLAATQFSHLCNLPFFNSRPNLKLYKNYKAFQRVCFFVSCFLFFCWLERTKNLAERAGRKSWCSLVYPLLTCLLILDFDRVLPSLQTQEGSVPAHSTPGGKITIPKAPPR